MIKPQTLKGFRDFLPEQAKKRQYVINKLKTVFESYGFEPLETPALEYEEVLLGKYGEEGDKLMYRFEDNGKRRVALRYDQTVPLARVVAQYQNELPIPFKRYQIQPVWRAENTQKGRFREFLQCDIDTVGNDSPLSDAEVIAVAARSLDALGFNQYKILINDRNIFGGIPIGGISILDKLKKLGRDETVRQLVKNKIVESYDKEAVFQKAQEWLTQRETEQPTERIKQIISYLENMGINRSLYEFSPLLARGLDYYTSTIFEIEIEGYEAGSVCGGGRYGHLIGLFLKNDIPAVGFAFGFDRVMDAMEQLNLFPKELQTTKVLVTIFPASLARGQGGSNELKEKSIELSSRLRSNNIATELYLEENIKMEKQLKYADQKGIPYVVVIGPDEAAKDMVTLRNMKTREQKTVGQNDLLKELSSRA